MDIVYVVGGETSCADNELRYSLRALDAHVKNVERVFIIGRVPDWISDEVIGVPVQEVEGNKEYRIGKKFLNAIDEGILDRPFLAFNDDYFCFSDWNADNYPNYAREWPEVNNPHYGYGASIENTRRYLTEKGTPPIGFFDIHKPIVYEPKRFEAIREDLEHSKGLEFGMVVKTLYATRQGIEPVFVDDIKIRGLKKYEDIAKVYNKDVISCYDEAWHNGLGDYLKSRFREKCKFEL